VIVESPTWAGRPLIALGRDSSSGQSVVSPSLSYYEVIMPDLDFFMEEAEKAFWHAHFLRQWRRPVGKPGEYYLNLKMEVQERLKRITSADLAKVRPDAIAVMLLE
jgi:hypothetical protein